MRAPFLGLLQDHILKLDAPTLHPTCKGIILALLPGLEEETSEDFERTYQLLNAFRKGVRVKTMGDEYFWQCFFQATVEGNNRRLGALAYLNRELPKLGGQERAKSSATSATADGEAEDAAKTLTAPEPGWLPRCFAAGLKDDQILIQRGFLDLLVSHLPLHSSVLRQRIKPEDLELLILAASGVVSRRDMSLNRRLWSWLLGPDPTVSRDGDTQPNDESKTAYFSEFGLKPLTRSILKMIEKDEVGSVDRARPMRICTSLMDRWEIGGLVVKDIFLPVMRSAKRYESQAKSKQDSNEVMKSASVFFDGVESKMIWMKIHELLQSAVETKKDAVIAAEERMKSLELVSFIVGHFNVREAEMVGVHIPTTALSILVKINDRTERGEGLDEVDMRALGLVQELWDGLPHSNIASPPSNSRDTTEQLQQSEAEVQNKHILFRIEQYYNQDSTTPSSTSPFSPRKLHTLLLREATDLATKSFHPPSSKNVPQNIHLLVSLLFATPTSLKLGGANLLADIHTALATPSIPFPNYTTIITLLTTLYPTHLSASQLSELIDPLATIAWQHLSPSKPKYHVEAVRSLWTLQSCIGHLNHSIEASLCRLMTSSDVEGTFAQRDADAGRRFGVLWMHTLHSSAAPPLSNSERMGSKADTGKRDGQLTSIDYKTMLARPLFLVLDSLADERTQLFASVRIWIQNLPSLERVFAIYATELRSFEFLFTIDAGEEMKVGGEDDVAGAVYYLHCLLNILRWSTMETWNILSLPVEGSTITYEEFFVRLCMTAISLTHPSESESNNDINQLQRTALSVLHIILVNPGSPRLVSMELEGRLIALLAKSLQDPDPFLQVPLLDTILAALRLKTAAIEKSKRDSEELCRNRSPDGKRNSLVVNTEKEKPQPAKPLSPTALALIECLKAAINADSSRVILDNWVAFLAECIPLFSDSIFQFLIPLVDTFCSQISANFEGLKSTFSASSNNVGYYSDRAPETTLIALLNGLELILIRAHERLLVDEAAAMSLKSPEHTPTGFFGNMVSGFSSAEADHSRSQTANNRLTVLLSFQDAVKICFKIWSWGGKGRDGFVADGESAASFQYTNQRMKNRSRRCLELLFAREPLECLETVIGVWQRASTSPSKDGAETYPQAAFHVLNVLDESRPKNTIPAIFDSIYSRTNPSALDPSRKSTLSYELQDSELVVFLVEYTQSLEDDAMDDIWSDCMVFLKDILANPFPHRLVLPGLLHFVGVIGEKVHGTSLGDQGRMRKDLGDIFIRVLTAVFTTNPVGYIPTAAPGSNSDTPVSVTDEKQPIDTEDPARSLRHGASDIVTILAHLVPSLPKILSEPEKILSAVTTISTSLIAPSIRQKSFPHNLSPVLLDLVYRVTKLPQNNLQKVWKRDVGDAFNSPRFFAVAPESFEEHWVRILRSWTLMDNSVVPELLGRLQPPSTAGIVFGVGATSARQEADRRTAATLSRVTALILAGRDDALVAYLGGINEKVVELLGATPTSSPSAATRADVFKLWRAIASKVSPIHLASLWPVINAELHNCFSSVVADRNSMAAEKYNGEAIVEAAKLLDTILVLRPEDWVVGQWSWVIDNVDAVHRPDSPYSLVAHVDRLSEELAQMNLENSQELNAGEYESTVTSLGKDKRRTFLGKGRLELGGGEEGISGEDLKAMGREEVVGRLRPWFSGLSIWAFEGGYDMGAVDSQGLRREIVEDMFE